MIGAALLFVAFAPSQAQEAADSPMARLTPLQRGHARYLRYCAACHGEDASGNGPMASSLRAPPPDLRRITERAGRFDRRAIAALVDGRNMAHAHGSEEMPVWGWRGLRARKDAGGPSGRMLDILAYLESIQIQPAPKPKP
jgi:mono/diheme cytochrome c family protein